LAAASRAARYPPVAPAPMIPMLGKLTSSSLLFRLITASDPYAIGAGGSSGLGFSFGFPVRRRRLYDDLGEAFAAVILDPMKRAGGIQNHIARADAPFLPVYSRLSLSLDDDDDIDGIPMDVRRGLLTGFEIDTLHDGLVAIKRWFGFLRRD